MPDDIYAIMNGNDWYAWGMQATISAEGGAVVMANPALADDDEEEGALSGRVEGLATYEAATIAKVFEAVEAQGGEVFVASGPDDAFGPDAGVFGTDVFGTDGGDLFIGAGSTVDLASVLDALAA